MRFTIQLLRRLGRQRLFIVLASVLTVVQCFMELYLPLLMAQIINEGVLAENNSVISSLGRVMLAVCIVMGVSGYGVSMCCAYVSQKFALDLRKDLFSRISSFSLPQIERLRPGSLITRITSDVANCASFVDSCVTLFIEPVLLMFGGIYMMSTLAPALGAVFAVFTVLQLIIMALFIRKTSPMFMAVQKITDRINSGLQTVFSNFRLIKSFTTEEYEMNRFGEENGNLYASSFRVQKLLAVFSPVVLLLMNLAIVFILACAGISASGGSIQIGNVTAAITYAEQILLAIMVGGQLFRLAIEAEPSSQRISEILSQQTDMPETGLHVPDRFSEIICKSVSFSYPESGHVLEQCDFRIGRGDFIAVTGKIGCGKSTLVNLLARLYDVTDGSVLLNGKDIREYIPSEVRRCVSVADRQAFVFDGTFEDNIRMGRDYVTSPDVRQALEAAQCAGFIDGSRDGLGTHLAAQGRSLSGGEKQRLVIARALAGRPGLLILDDCTSAIDYQTERALLTAIRKEYPETAVLLVTHRLVSARMADRIAVLSGRHFAAQGTDSELRQTCEVYRELCRTQESSEEVCAHE